MKFYCQAGSMLELRGPRFGEKKWRELLPNSYVSARHFAFQLEATNFVELIFSKKKNLNLWFDFLKFCNCLQINDFKTQNLVTRIWSFLSSIEAPLEMICDLTWRKNFVERLKFFACIFGSYVLDSLYYDKFLRSEEIQKGFGNY